MTQWINLCFLLSEIYQAVGQMKIWVDLMDVLLHALKRDVLQGTLEVVKISRPRKYLLEGCLPP